MGKIENLFNEDDPTMEATYIDRLRNEIKEQEAICDFSRPVEERSVHDNGQLLGLKIAEFIWMNSPENKAKE